MLPGLQPDLPTRPPALSSVAVRPSQFRLAPFCRLPLRLSFPHDPRQPTFPPFPTSSSRLPAPPAPSRSVPRSSRRNLAACPRPPYSCRRKGEQRRYQGNNKKNITISQLWLVFNTCRVCVVQVKCVHLLRLTRSTYYVPTISLDNL